MDFVSDCILTWPGLTGWLDRGCFCSPDQVRNPISSLVETQEACPWPGVALAAFDGAWAVRSRNRWRAHRHSGSATLRLLCPAVLDLM